MRASFTYRRAVLGSAAAILALTSALPAMAQNIDVQVALGTPAVQAAIRACGNDRERLCAGVMPGGGRIVRCLASKPADLSPTCRTAMLAAQDVLVKAGVLIPK